MTKSGMGMWDWGCGIGDAGLGTQGLGDAGTWDSGMPGRGTRGRGDMGRKDLETRGCLGTPGHGTQGLKDMINKQHLNFARNLQFTIFGGQDEGITCRRVCQQTSS